MVPWFSLFATITPRVCCSIRISGCHETPEKRKKVVHTHHFTTCWFTAGTLNVPNDCGPIKTHGLGFFRFPFWPSYFPRKKKAAMAEEKTRSEAKHAEKNKHRSTIMDLGRFFFLLFNSSLFLPAWASFVKKEKRKKDCFLVGTGHTAKAKRRRRRKLNWNIWSQGTNDSMERTTRTESLQSDFSYLLEKFTWKDFGFNDRNT